MTSPVVGSRLRHKLPPTCLFQCTLPFDLSAPRRRPRSYSFTGSERSSAATPTPPAEVDAASKEHVAGDKDGEQR